RFECDVAKGDELVFDLEAEGFAPLHAKRLRTELSATTRFIRDDAQRIVREEIDLDWQLERATPIAGRCIDVRGAPVADVRLRFWRFDPERQQPQSLEPSSATGPDGRFVVP